MANTETGQYLTPEGKAELEERLHYLETEKREEVGERIRIAREFGDISENSEFDDAKEEQRQVENEINRITYLLAHAEVIDSSKAGKNVVIGSTVTLKDEKGGLHEFTIVGGAEADFSLGKISNDSPAGAACLGKRKGDTIEYVGPTGRKMKFTIEKVGH